MTKKLTLGQIKVTSFATAQEKNIKGGGLTANCGYCDHNTCIYHGCSEACV